jgi:hypothetical protein
MAAPVVSQFNVFGFRDAKGQTARLRVLIGGATIAAVQTNVGTLRGHLAAASNAHVYAITYANTADRTYGTAATYVDAEDKLLMTFVDVNSNLHKYRIAAPVSTDFQADQETWKPADAAVSNIITDFQTFCYGTATDTSPLTAINGIRVRARFQRKFNSLTKQPDLTGPGE